LRTIKYCSFIIAGAIVAADVYLMTAAHSSNDDPAGAVMLGIIATFVSIVIGTAASVFERVLQAEKVGITMANISVLKNGKAKAIRLSTLETVCKALECQPGDILEYK